MKKAHWFIFFLLFAISCLDQPDCFRLNNNVIGIAFRKLYDRKADTVFMVAIHSPTAPNVVFNPEDNSPVTYLPLDFFNKETSYTLESLYGTNHLSFGYDVKTQFVSADCGARYILDQLALLDDDYDSVRLVSTLPTSSAEGYHLEVFRCPRTNLMKVRFRQLQGETSVELTPKITGILPDYTGALYTDTTVSVVNLPVNPGNTETRFTFNFRDYGSNFMTVKYTTIPWEYDTAVCGHDLKLYHKLKVEGAGGFDFDSLRITRDSLQDPPITNITAYRCPDTDLVRIFFRSAANNRVADRLPVTSITNNEGKVVYQNTKVSELFTLPLIVKANQTSGQTEFTFKFSDGTPDKKLAITYTQKNAGLPFGACSEQPRLTTLRIASSDFTSGPSTLPAIDSTTFPVSTNFEIIK